MKKIIITLIFLLIPLTSKALTGTASQIGGTTHYSFSDGASGTSYNISGTTHYGFSDGTSGTAYEIGGIIHYSFTDPLNNSYDLGGKNTINYPIYKYVPGEYYAPNGLTMINNSCKGLSSSVYPNWTSRGVELTTKCLGEERLKYSDENWNMTVYQNSLSKCTHEGPEQALKEILDICTREQAKLFVNRVNITESNLQKENNVCPQFSQLFLDTPGCTKDTDQFFPVNKSDCCVCNLDYKNYKRSCITEVEYNKKIKADAKDKKVIVTPTSPKQELVKSNNTEEIVKEITAPNNDEQIIKEKTNQIDKQQITNTNLEKPSNPVKISWFRRFINFLFGKK
jgi:hypothetical protein